MRCIVWKQTSPKQTAETVSAKRRITQIVAQWVPSAGPATANARRPYVLRLCRGTTRWWRLAERRWRRLATSEMGIQQSVKYPAACSLKYPLGVSHGWLRDRPCGRVYRPLRMTTADVVTRTEVDSVSAWHQTALLWYFWTRKRIPNG